MCREDGRCTFMEKTQFCDVVDSAQCEASEGCGEFGKCTHARSKCRALSGADCAHTKLCDGPLDCVVDHKKCIPAYAGD